MHSRTKEPDLISLFTKLAKNDEELPDAWHVENQKQESAIILSASKMLCNEESEKREIMRSRLVAQYNTSKGALNVGRSEDKLCKYLFNWCLANTIVAECDYYAAAPETDADLILEPGFSKALERAIKASEQVIYKRQSDAWTWLLRLGAGICSFAPATNFNTNYTVATSSAEKWEKLLLIQRICCLDFVKAVKAWLTKSDHKKNCFFVWGRVSTGKTLFANAIRGLFLHRQMSNSTGTSNFSFGNCLNTRVIIYEEPFLHPTLLEDMKSLFGGAELTVDAKYTQQQPLRRTPILVTSNVLNLSRGHAPEMSEQALQARSFLFKFDSDISSLVRTVHFEPLDFAVFVKKFSALLPTDDNSTSCACATCSS